METTVTYTATASPTGAEEDLLSRIRGIIDERDAYRAKCARQGAIIAKLADMMGELQAFIDEAPQGNGAETPAVTAAPEPSPAKVEPPEAKATPGTSARRYTEADVLMWASALRTGMSQIEVSNYYQVSTRTIRKRLTDLGYDPATGFPRNAKEIARVEFAPTPAVEDTEPETPDLEPEPDDDGIVIDVSDDAIATWVQLMDEEHRTAEWIADRWGIDPYYVRGRVRQWREEHGETVEAFEAA